jgi:hypothetical protein
MYATRPYSGVSHNSRIGDGHSGQYCRQLNRHNRPFNVVSQVSSGHTRQPRTRFQALIMQKRQSSLP